MYSVVVSFSERAKHRAIVLYIIIIPLHHYDTIRYDTIEEINVDSKAEYTA